MSCTRPADCTCTLRFSLLSPSSYTCWHLPTFLLLQIYAYIWPPSLNNRFVFWLLEPLSIQPQLKFPLPFYLHSRSKYVLHTLSHSPVAAFSSGDSTNIPLSGAYNSLTTFHSLPGSPDLIHLQLQPPTLRHLRKPPRTQSISLSLTSNPIQMQRTHTYKYSIQKLTHKQINT